MSVLAVTKSETSPQGALNDDAIHVITTIAGDPRQGKPLTATVGSFISTALYEAGKEPYCIRRYRFDNSQADPSHTNLWADIKASAEHDGFFTSGTGDVTVLTHP